MHNRCATRQRPAPEVGKFIMQPEFTKCSSIAQVSKHHGAQTLAIIFQNCMRAYALVNSSPSHMVVAADSLTLLVSRFMVFIYRRLCLYLHLTGLLALQSTKPNLLNINLNLKFNFILLVILWADIWPSLYTLNRVLHTFVILSLINAPFSKRIRAFRHRHIQLSAVLYWAVRCDDSIEQCALMNVNAHGSWWLWI